MAYDLGSARGVIELDYNGRGVDQAKKGLKDVEQSGSKGKAALDKMGRGAAIAGAAVVAGLGVAVNSAANFEQRMSAINAVSGATPKQMEAVRSKALQLGKDTVFSASEAGNAIEELVKAGISIPDVMNGAADATVALAAAGEVSLPEAATIAANSMNQFGLTAQEMPKIADAIAGAANASAIDVSDFGQSLQQVGAVAHLAGVNFKDTATAIALMGNAGIKGSDAGTSLKSMFMRLQPTTQKQFQTMQELGLITGNLGDANKFLQKQGLGTARTIGGATKKFEELAQSMDKGKVGTVKNANAAQQLMLRYGGLRNEFYKANGQTKGLAQVSGVLQKSLKGMTKEQQQATLSTLFGSDAIRAAAILADNGAKGFDKMARSMGKVKAADVAAKRMDNFKGSLEQMRGSLETAGIAIGTILLPTLRKIVDAVTGMLNKFLQLPGGVQKAITIFAMVVGVVLLLVAGIIKLVRFIEAARAAFIAIRAVMATTWIAALGPIALVIAAIAAVVAIIIILWKHSETFRSIVIGAWNAIKAAAAAVAHWFAGPFVNFFTSAWDAIKSALGAVRDWFVSVWNGIKAVVSTVVGAIAAVIKAYVGIWLAVIRAGLGVIRAVWHNLWSAFGPLVRAVFGLIVALVRLNWTIIKGLFILAGRVIRTATSAAWHAILAVIRTVWGIIRGVVSAGANFVKGVVSRVWGAIRGVTSAVWNAISGVVRAVWGRIRGVVSAGVGAVRGVVSGAWHAVAGVTSSVWNNVVGIIRGVVGRIGAVVGGIKDRVVGAVRGAGSWLFNAGREIVQGIINGITSMINAVTSKINQLTSIIKDHLPGSPVKRGPLKVLNQGHAGQEIVRMVIDGIGDMARPLADAMSGVTVAAAAPIASPGAGLVPRARGAHGSGAPSGLRLVRGELTLDKRGRAFISGVAQETYDGNAAYEDNVGRMSG